MPSKLIHFQEAHGCFGKHQTVVGDDDCNFITRLSEIKSAIFAKHSAENNAILSAYDENKSNTYQKNKHNTIPVFCETAVRMIDWITHFRWNLHKLLMQVNQKEVFWTELLPFQIYSNDIFIPALAYYIYTLEEITI